MSRLAVALVSVLAFVTACGGRSSVPGPAIPDSTRAVERRPQGASLYAASGQSPPTVSVYDLSGNLRRAFHSGGIVPVAIAVDTAGDIYVSAFQGIRAFSVVEVRAPDGHLVRTVTQDVEQVNGLATRERTLYTVNEFPLQAGPTPVVNYVSTYGNRGAQELQRFDGGMTDLQAVGLDGAGNVYVLNGPDTNRGQAAPNVVTIHEPSGAVLRTIPVAAQARGLAVTSHGTFFVVTLDLGTSDELVTAYREGRPPTVLLRKHLGAFAVAVDQNDALYVATSPRTVNVYSDEGALLRTIELRGTDPSAAIRAIAVR